MGPLALNVPLINMGSFYRTYWKNEFQDLLMFMSAELRVSVSLLNFKGFVITVLKFDNLFCVCWPF